MYADQRSDLITSLARDARDYKSHEQRRIYIIYDATQTTLGVLRRRFHARARTRRLGSEEMKSRGERSRIIEQIVADDGAGGDESWRHT